MGNIMWSHQRGLGHQSQWISDLYLPYGSWLDQLWRFQVVARQRKAVLVKNQAMEWKLAKQILFALPNVIQTAIEDLASWRPALGVNLSNK